VVPPSIFRDDWTDKPTESICCGIRNISLEDVSTIRKMSAEHAVKSYPSYVDEEPRIEAYNDSILRLIVARSTCDANNVAEPWEIWQGMPEDMAEVALSVEGARWMYGQIERIRIESCITLPEATDEAIEELADLFAIARMNITEAQEQRVRRLLQFVTDELSEIASHRKEV